MKKQEQEPRSPPKETSEERNDSRESEVNDEVDNHSRRRQSAPTEVKNLTDSALDDRVARKILAERMAVSSNETPRSSQATVCATEAIDSNREGCNGAALTSIENDRATAKIAREERPSVAAVAAARPATNTISSQQQAQTTPSSRIHSLPSRSRGGAVYSDSTSSLDARIAMKIVEERISSMHAEEALDGESSDQNDNQRECHPNDNNHSDGNFDATTQQRQSEPTPGAVRVAGINRQSQESNDDSAGAGTVRLGDSMVQMYHPEAMIEATMVQSTLEPNPSSLVVNAEPIDLESMQGKSQTSKIHEDVELMDVVQHKKLSIGILAAIAIVSTIALAIGLTVGILIRRTNDRPEATVAQITTTAPEPVELFSDALDPETIAEIYADSLSPHYKANQWVIQDPNRGNLSLERRVIRFTLALIYYALGGDNWFRRDGWLEHDTNECDWFTSHPTPVCDNGLFVFLNLTGNNLQGSLVNEIASSLRIVDLSNNSLVGQLAQLSGVHANLEIIDISENGLSGKLAGEIGWYSERLRVVRVAGNNLYGTIPGALGFVTPKIQEFDVSGNQFSGTVPSIWGRDLQILSFAGNRMKGTLPSSLDQLTTLRYYNVSRNVDIVGTLPAGIASLPNLTQLDISHTHMEGTIPEDMCQESTAAGGVLEIRADCSMVQCCLES